MEIRYASVNQKDVRTKWLSHEVHKLSNNLNKSYASNIFLVHNLEGQWSAAKVLKLFLSFLKGIVFFMKFARGFLILETKKERLSGS